MTANANKALVRLALRSLSSPVRAPVPVDVIESSYPGVVAELIAAGLAVEDGCDLPQCEGRFVKVTGEGEALVIEWIAEGGHA